MNEKRGEEEEEEEKEKEKEDCVICMDDLSTECSCHLNCNHKFHTRCFLKWTEYNDIHTTQVTCPFCRKQIQSDEILKISLQNIHRDHIAIEIVPDRTDSSRTCSQILRQKVCNYFVFTMSFAVIIILYRSS